jgi:hypothetical protein
VPDDGGGRRDSISMRVLTNEVSELEKLQKARMQVAKTNGIQHWNKALWSQ